MINSSSVVSMQQLKTPAYMIEEDVGIEKGTGREREGKRASVKKRTPERGVIVRGGSRRELEE